MYTPAPFVQAEREALFRLMEEYSFAILISRGAEANVTSHLPLVLDRKAGPHGTLYGHIARPNEHRHQEGTPTSAIFSGPHAYISPRWYREPGTVPTWNYLAVHAHGQFEIIHDREVILETLQRMAHIYEPGNDGWRFDPDDSAVAGLLEGIVAFRLPIDRLEGKWKLNQNHLPERRRRVIDALRLSTGVYDRAIADLMERELESDQADD